MLTSWCLKLSRHKSGKQNRETSLNKLTNCGVWYLTCSHYAHGLFGKPVS